MTWTVWYGTHVVVPTITARRNGPLLDFYCTHLDKVCYPSGQEGEWPCQWSQQWERHEGHRSTERVIAGDANIQTEGHHGELEEYNNVMTWASYQIRKIASCACAGDAGNVFRRGRLQRKPLVNDPGMHHGTCVTHVPWCMSGSLTRGGGENVPGIPGACAPAILRIWQEAHGNVFCITDPLWGETTGGWWFLPRSGEWCGALLFSLLLN